MGKLGLGPAQQALNRIRDETIEALESQVRVLLGRIDDLESSFGICRTTLKRVEDENRELMKAVAELTLRLQRYPAPRGRRGEASDA